MTIDLHPLGDKDSTTRTLLLNDAERQRTFRACLDALARPGVLQHLSHPLHAPVELPMLALTDLMTPIAAIDGGREPSDAIDSRGGTRKQVADPGAAEGAATKQPGPTGSDNLTRADAADNAGRRRILAQADATRAVEGIAGLTRAPITTPEAARWVLTGLDPDPARIAALSTGTALEPHLGTMVCLAVEGLAVDEPACRDEDELGVDATESGLTGAQATSPGETPGQQSASNSSDWLTLALSGPGIPGSRRVRVAGLSCDLLATRAGLNATFPRGIDMLCIAPTGELLGLPRTTTIEETR